MHERGTVIRQATIDDLEELADLFDSYRQFYRQMSDIAGASEFLRARFEHEQSAVFIAEFAGVAVGFTQLYPSFSSASMAPIFVLNDLFVKPEMRRQGVGRALLEGAAAYARRVGAARLALATEINNVTAQSLYEQLGWRRDEAFYHYTLQLRA